MSQLELAKARARMAQLRSGVTPEELAERDRMIEIAEKRMERGADIESATDQDGLTYDPRTGTYKNRNAIVEGYEPTRTDAAIGGVTQGTGLNWGDEAIGAMASVVEGPEYGPLRREQARGQFERQQEAFPYTYGGAELAGNVATGSMALPWSTGAGLFGTVGRGIGIGALEGTIYGSGKGEGLEDRANQAAQYGMVGGAIGGLSPIAVAGIRRGGQAAWDMATGGLDTMLNRGGQNRARRAVVDALVKSGKSLDEVQDAVTTAAREGQPDFRAMDAMGNAGRRAANSITRKGGDGAEELFNFLDARQSAAAERLAPFIDEAYGMGGKTANQTRTAMTAARDQAADVAYGAARGNASPVDIRGALAVIDDRIGGMSGSNVAGDSIDGRLASFRNRLAASPAPDGEISRELSDFDRVLGVKQDVQDAIGVAVRAGRNNEARELGKLVKALDEALEASSDMYRTANDGFRTASQNIDAIDTGAGFVAPSRRSADTIEEFSRLTPEQQTAARVGAGDKMLAKLEANPAPTANKAKPFQSPKMRAETEAMTLDPDLFARRIGREDAMWQTQNTALRGSQTVNNAEDVASNGMGANLVRAARSLMNFQGGDALANVGAALGPIVQGQNEPTRQIIAQILMSSDPEAALRSAVKTREGAQAVQRIVEALSRNAGREPAHSAMIPR